VQRGIVEETLYKEGRKWLDLGRREKGHRERTERGYCYAIWLARIKIIQKWNGGTLSAQGDVAHNIHKCICSKLKS